MPAIGAIFAFISGAKWFWTIIRNWGAIKQIIVNVEQVAQGMLSRKTGLPSCEETKILLDSLKLLFERELIDLPGVNEVEIGRILGNIEANLNCSIEKVEVKNGQ